VEDSILVTQVGVLEENAIGFKESRLWVLGLLYIISNFASCGLKKICKIIFLRYKVSQFLK